MPAPPLTPFGRALRLLRLDRGWRAKEMAAGIGVSSSFLSAVETGRKTPPERLVARIIAWGALTPEEARAVRAGYAGTVESLVLRIPATMSPEHRETAALLARHFARLTSADLAEIRERIVRCGLDAGGDPV